MKVVFLSRSIIVFTLNLCVLAAPVVSRADILYASDGDQLEKFDSLGVSTVITSANSGSFIVDGLAFDKAGNLYAADQSIPAILKFNSSGVSTVFGSAGGIGPQGIAFDSAGNLYEALNGNNAIEKFDPSGNRTVFAAGTLLGVGLNFPVDLAIDSSNNLYVSGQLNTIVKINPSGVVTTFATASTGVSYPLGLALDSAGNLYAANSGNGTIEKFNSAGVGTVFASILSPSGWPDGLAFDSSGNLYVSVAGAGIEEFNSLGVGTVFENSTDASFIAFEPVPEPSTCELLAVGLIGLLVARGRGVRALGRREFRSFLA